MCVRCCLLQVLGWEQWSSRTVLGDRLLTSPDNWNFSSVVLFPDLFNSP